MHDEVEEYDELFYSYLSVGNKKVIHDNPGLFQRSN